DGAVVAIPTASIDDVCERDSSEHNALGRNATRGVRTYQHIVQPRKPGWIWGMNASANGRWIAACANDGTIQLLNARTLEQEHVLKGHTGQAWCAAFSPDSTLLATGAEHSGGGDIRIWDPEGGRQIRHIEAHQAQVTGLAFVPGRKMLASCSLDGDVRFWKP